MIAYTRLLFLQPSGVLLNASALDTLLTMPTNSPLKVISEATGGVIDVVPSGLVIQPSVQSLHEFKASLENVSSAEEAQHSLYVPNKTEDQAASQHLLWRSSALVVEDENFDAKGFLQQVAYIRLFDTNILGPDYNNPRHVFLASRPDNLEARQVWEDLYENYRTQRMNICGLDLEPIPSG